MFRLGARQVQQTRLTAAISLAAHNKRAIGTTDDHPRVASISPTNVSLNCAIALLCLRRLTPYGFVSDWGKPAAGNSPRPKSFRTSGLP